mmetsp:Transcript_62501/g.179267  ORF Transcript_62501/g.179267 Transcript_62501/m.179267 type:complete len:261 (+) Transcript_62501:154-936(+)
MRSPPLLLLLQLPLLVSPLPPSSAGPARRPLASLRRSREAALVSAPTPAEAFFQEQEAADPNDLSGALAGVLAGGSGDIDLTSGSVWPAEEPDPNSGYESPFRRRRTAAPPAAAGGGAAGDAGSTKIVEKIVYVNGPGPGGEPCPACAGMEADCPPSDCSAEAASAAAAAAAANAAAQAAARAAAALPSSEALESQALAGAAADMARAGAESAMHALAEASAGLEAVVKLRSDLRSAASARASELDRVRVVPPTFPVAMG